MGARLSLAWILGGVVLGVSAGCGTEEPELVIVQNQAPLADGCELSQAATRDRLREGVFDLVLGDRSSYVLTPLVRNGGTEELSVTQAHVAAAYDVDGEWTALVFACEGCDAWDLDVCAGGACPTIAPGRTASFEVPILPRIVTGYFQMLMDGAVREGRVPPEFRVRTEVTLRALAGEREVESAPFVYETRLCLGCLVEFPEGTDAPGIAGPDCCGSGAPPTTCLAGQDAPIDCRACIRTSPELCNYGRTSCGLF